MKIWINAPFSVENTELIKKSAVGAEVYTGADPIYDAEIIVGQLSPDCDLTMLKLLQSTNAGVEKLLDGSVPENVKIANVTGAFGEVISEYIIAGILALSRRIFDYRKNQEIHLWKPVVGDFLLYGKTALIFGCGDIGSNTAIKLKAFGMKTVGIRRKPAPAKGFDEIYGIEETDNLLPDTDVIICCLPHTPQTEKMLGTKQFQLFKPGSIFVNVGRGSVIDTEVLTKALLSGKLFGAVLDVFEQEPLPSSSPLWDMENVLITPHISGPSFGHFPEVERKIAEICAENISRYISGKPLINVINRSIGYAERGVNSCRT